ncbi:MAG: AAA family ATPase [Anaerolineales bacterium]|nr:AAA family ATPase [Anaerolineales bacterium]
MPKAVAVCGHICSGKSSVIAHLSKSYNWNVISFGKYIRHLALTQGLSPTREVYQTLGQEVVSRGDPHQFLHQVIRFNQPASEVHLFDGIRHVSVFDALRQVYDDTLVIFLDLSHEQRYRRFMARAAEDDPSLTYEEFLRLSDQPVERGISEIADLTDYRVDAAAPLQKIINEIDQVLAFKRFTS